MNTKQIEYILELTASQNFNRAAENLYISQPTMTYQIKAVEDEIGFPIFERSGKGAALTPAGAQFVSELKRIYDDLKTAIEHGQNFSSIYSENIRIAMPIRSAIHHLPDAIKEFSRTNASISITPMFDWSGCTESFLKGDQDILFAMEHEVKRIPDITIHKLYDSRFYLITKRDDPLAEKPKVSSHDLAGRTLMIGGGSPPVLKALQRRVIAETGISYFNSHDHDTTLTNVASDKGVCIAPGFLDDHNGEFAWIPFDCTEVIPCVLCTHKNDSRWSVMEFVRTIQSFYL